MIIYFDTETTGLAPGRIIQLSYIVENKEGVIGKNFFFGVDYISPQATAVHGFTVEKLAELSQGKSFSSEVEEIYDDFKNADLIVAHNSKFDIGFMNAEFNYLDRQFAYNEVFDTMTYFTPILKLPPKLAKRNNVFKFPKLFELCDFFEVYPYDVSRELSKLFGELSITAHDARYDTAAMYLSVKTARDSIIDLDEYLINKQ